MTKGTLKRVGIAAAFPALCLFGYWRHVDEFTHWEQLLWPAAIATEMSIGTFFYAPLARKFKTSRPVWALVIGIALLTAVMVWPTWWSDDAAWAEALFMVPFLIPLIQIGCIRLYEPGAFRSIPDPWRAT